MAKAMETADKIADAINKLGVPKLAAAVAVVAGGLLWLPDRLLTKAKVLPFRNAHADWIAAVFWLSLVFVVICFVPWLIGSMGSKPSERKRRKYFLKRLKCLTDDETACLREFIRMESRTVELPSEHPTVIALTQARLIWIPSQIAHPRINYDKPRGLTYPVVFHINDTVWDILQEDKAKHS